GDQPQQSGGPLPGPSVDGLATPNPLPLLPPEELPGFTFNIVTTPLAPDNNVSPPLVLIGALNGIVEEEQLTGLENQSQAGKGNEDTNDQTASGPNPVGNADGLDTDTASNLNNVTLHSEGNLATILSGGTPPFTFTIVDVTADDGLGTPASAENNFVHNTAGDRVTSLGVDVHYVVVSTTEIQGWAGDPQTGGRLVFTLTVSPDGHYTFDLNDQIDHPDHTNDNGSNPVGALEETLQLDFSSIIHVSDNGGHDAVLSDLSTSPVFTVGVIDDTP